MEADTYRRQVNRVDRADLEADSVRLPAGAGVLLRQIGALARSYFGAIDAGDVDTMVRHLDPMGFDIHVLAPDAHLKCETDYREWYSSIVTTFGRLNHTVVDLQARLATADTAWARVAIHSELDRRDPAPGQAPRLSVTVEIVWDLRRTDDSGWVITRQSEAPDPAPACSTVRTREFAVNYLQNLDCRNLEGMLAVLAPQGELNIALNQGLIIEDFPQWFKAIDAAFINSVHRVQGLVALENADGTIDAHLRIHFTADRRAPEPGQDARVDFSVERIWTIRPDADGNPQLVNQRPFVEFDLCTRLDPLDVTGAIGAVRRGDAEVVRDWLEQGGDPNAFAPSGFNVFLAAAATGNADVLRLLLLEGVGPHAADPTLSLKDPQRPDYDTGILALHLATQKGDVNSTKLLLSRSPEQLHARIEVNGHTPLLQAAFYGHVEVAKAILAGLGSILPGGADVEAGTRRLFTHTTLRGINATQFGRQFRNAAMVAVLEPLDTATEEEKAADTRALLEAIPAGTRHRDAGSSSQQASEVVFDIITSGLAEVAALDGEERAAAVARVTASLKDATENPAFEPDRLAGHMLQTPIIAAVTGTSANEDVARLRLAMVDILLEKGADPDREEMYPMAVDAIIRAAVFNHLDCLRKFEAVMTPDAIRTALNHKPAVNGLTALHDSVLRATTGANGYLDQIRWARGLGASADIPDHTGRTQRDFARAAFATAGQKENAAAVWDALQPGEQPPKPYRVFTYENLTFLTIPDHVADKGSIWRTLATVPDMIVRNIDLYGPNAMSAEVVQNHDFGTATMNRHWPDGRLIDARDMQAFAAQSRGTPFLPIMRFNEADPYIKQLAGAGLFGALFVNPDSPESVRAMLRDVYFPQRPTADIAPRTSTAEFPLGKRAVGADNLAQRSFAEYPRMMDIVNTMFIGGLSFSDAARPEVLADLAGLRQVGVRMIEIDHASIRSAHGPERAAAMIAEIEAAANEAGIVLSGHFSTDAEILTAFEAGYRHITTVTERGAHDAAWRTWLPGGSALRTRAPLPREMPIRPPSPESNDVRRALADGELVVFGAMTTPDIHNALQFARSGILNALAIEREHGTWTTAETVRHIEALRDHTNVIVRTCSALDPDVDRLVEAGVTALIATAVRGAAEARIFLAAVERANLETHGEAARQKWVVPVIMMETEEAARDTDEIVALLKEHQGVCHPGPLDLSASLGAAWGTPKYESTLRRIEEASKAAGVPLAGVLNTLEQSLEHGFGMVLAPMAMDAGALNAGILGLNPLESLQADNSAR
jgi:2-keto-3-deoxy-L-rhamnonate aldolase RhmA/ketosteroid isomerase-like protein